MEKLLTRDEIKGINDLQTAVVPVPEWGGAVMVRGMSGRERDAFEQEVVERKGKKVDINLQNIRAKLVVHCAIDDAGRRLFGDSDVVWLTEKSAVALDRVATKARELSGLTEGDIEELAKNSESDQSDDSGSS